MVTMLRALRDDDFDRIFAWESDPAAVWMAAFTRQDPRDRAAFDAHYARVRSNPANTLLGIDSDGVLAGTIGSFTMEGDRELTYWVDPAQWGRGIATDAVRRFLEIETQRPLFGRVADGNVGSRRVLEKAGFVAIGEESAYAAGRREQTREAIFRLG